MKTNNALSNHAGRFATAWVTKLLPLLSLLILPYMVQAQFNYTINNGTITITGYTGPGGAVTIPNVINGYRVTAIGANAFYQCTTLRPIFDSLRICASDNQQLTKAQDGLGTTFRTPWVLGSCLLP